MINFTLDTAAINTALANLHTAILAEQKDHMEVIGLYLVSEVKLDFEKKSRGGTSFGVKWKPLKESTEIRKAQKKSGYKHEKGKSPPTSQINVDTGLLRNSPSPGYSFGGRQAFRVDAHQVTVSYAREYDKHVDEARPLIPDETPKEWTDECVLMTKEWLEEQIRKRLR